MPALSLLLRTWVVAVLTLLAPAGFAATTINFNTSAQGWTSTTGWARAFGYMQLSRQASPTPAELKPPQAIYIYSLSAQTGTGLNVMQLDFYYKGALVGSCRPGVNFATFEVNSNVDSIIGRLPPVDNNGFLQCWINGVTYDPENFPPVLAQPGSVATKLLRDTAPISLASQLGATDAAGQTLTWLGNATTSGGGVLTGLNAGTPAAIVYAPKAGYVGRDSFDITVRDNLAGASVKHFDYEIALPVALAEHPPVRKVLATFAHPLNSPPAGWTRVVSFDLLDQNGSIVTQGASLFFRVDPATGAVYINKDLTLADGASHYIRVRCNAKYAEVVDGEEWDSTSLAPFDAFVNVTVQASDDVRPVFVGGNAAIVDRNATVDLKNALHASDPNLGQTLTWTPLTSPTRGTVSFASAVEESGGSDIAPPAGTATYTSFNSTYTGADSFLVQIDDGITASTRTVAITIADLTPPKLSALARRVPTTPIATSTSVTWRATFNEATKGVDAGDFILLTTGPVTGTISNVAQVLPSNGYANNHDITVSGITGEGILQLQLKAAGTGIVDASNNELNTGFDSATFTIVGPNVAPTFVGENSLLSVGPGATDLKSLLHVSDLNYGQTLTWTVQTGPVHGVVALTSATAASGGSGLEPGGTLTYTPSAGYLGTDTFIIQVSDGALTATRTISVSVASADTTPPTVVSVVRKMPAAQAIAAGTTTVTFTVTYSKAVTGVVPACFALEAVGGSSITGYVSAVAPINGSVYDVAVTLTGGSGGFRLKVVN